MGKHQWWTYILRLAIQILHHFLAQQSRFRCVRNIMLPKSISTQPGDKLYVLRNLLTSKSIANSASRPALTARVWCNGTWLCLTMLLTCLASTSRKRKNMVSPGDLPSNKSSWNLLIKPTGVLSTRMDSQRRRIHSYSSIRLSKRMPLMLPLSTPCLKLTSYRWWLRILNYSKNAFIRSKLC